MGRVIGTITVNTERCKGCALCVESCPRGVIAMSKRVNVSGYSYVEAVNMDACIGCASCGIVCPDACITVYRKNTKKEKDDTK